MAKNFRYWRMLSFRNPGLGWIILAVFLWSCVPSVSFAQQPTAAIKALSGTVLVSGQAAKTGAVLRSGDTLQTQAGASVVLTLSDGSEIQFGEKTQINIADLAQTATGARVSSIKLLAGWVRAMLSAQHQQKGSSFTIETPNAQVGVKFSQPDVEVSYDPAKQETVGIAHTVELVVKNLLTGEIMHVPVGSTVIITAIGMKVIAGIVGAVSASSASTTATSSTATGTASTGASTGLSAGTIVAIGAGVAAAGGVAAVVAKQKGEEACTTAECTGDLSGTWYFSGSCVAQGCVEGIPCAPSPPDSRPYCCGIRMCDCCEPSWSGQVTQTGNMLSGELFIPAVQITYSLSGSVDGNSVSVTIDPDVIIPLPGGTSYTGIIDENTIRGTLSGSGYSWTPGGNVPVTWSGTFTVTIEKE